ncbi:Fic family protein [Paenibacillus sp. UNCCL117]|uniref:Fic family protein n=1 Tax=unclassified Paenibacillus TaxID=185978 RepID=UPI000882BBBC|nr:MULTISPECIES: Fic family protein [unclassified Paenibacillus]SDD83052.1 Fic family protein [Paenibacillus sp. cl123]SFW54974.1 Fic family protein [Paenibacillus sp. UNCCL117]
MRYIYKLYHERTPTEFNELYQHRFNFDSAIPLGLVIRPMSQPQTYELFYVPTNKMLNIVSKIYVVSNALLRTFHELPPVAQNQFINECLVEELYNSNQLEGIRSSREEIAKSAKEIKLNRKAKTRFDSMIKSYMGLLQDNIELPKVPADIRKIYDEITNGEIDLEELPDGEVFRKEATYVLKKSGTGKVIHQGVTPEKEISAAITQMLKFMNDKEDIPQLIKVAVGHYYFGYIHPFYDGNGRTSRFISSLYVSKTLGNIPSLSLSRGCNKYSNKYLEAFDFTNSIKSRGELNYFIEAFLTIMVETLVEMNTELKEKSELLGMAAAKLQKEPKLNGMEDSHGAVMFILAQNHFFDSNSGLTIKELAEILNKSEATLRKIVKELLDLSLISQIGERPAFYYIQHHYFEG